MSGDIKVFVVDTGKVATGRLPVPPLSSVQKLHLFLTSFSQQDHRKTETRHMESKVLAKQKGHRKTEYKQQDVGEILIEAHAIAFSFVRILWMIPSTRKEIGFNTSPSGFTLTWWGGIPHPTMETKKSHHPDLHTSTLTPART
jgi:hypothetical protein